MPVSGQPHVPKLQPYSVLRISGPPGAFGQYHPQGNNQDGKTSPGCTAISYGTGEVTHTRPGARLAWRTEVRASLAWVSLRLPRHGGHAPASGDLGVTHRGQWRAGTFCDFPGGIPDSGSHPASQAAQSMGKQGHHPRQEEGLCVCRHTAKSETRRSPAPPPREPRLQPLWLSVSSSVQWETTIPNHLGQRKWSKALAPASGRATVLQSLSAHSVLHPTSWADHNLVT